jgi:hypothetical protein
MRVGSISAPQQFVGVEVENRFQLLLERCLALMLILNQRQLAVELKMYIDDQAEIGYAWSELIEKILQEQDDDEVELIRLRAEYEQTMAAVGSDSRQLEQELRVLMRELKREYYRQKLNSLKRSISSAQTDELNKMLAEAAVYSEKLKQLEKNG